MDDLAGKVAVVTGAASGIGFGLAERFVAEGMKVVLADVEADALERAEKDLAGRGAETLALLTDVSDSAAVTALERAATEQFGSYHIVCNNAGVGGIAASSWETTDEAWRWVLDVNLWGVINGIRAFVPRLVEQREGHVVNTASLAAMAPMPFDAPYTASKHAVLAISRALWFELQMLGSPVGVTVLCPAWVRTAIADSGRNWPERLGPIPDSYRPEGPIGLVWETFKEVIANAEPPSALAARTVEAIRTRRFMVVTDEPVTAAAVQSVAGEVAGRDPTLPGLA